MPYDWIMGILYFIIQESLIVRSWMEMLRHRLVSISYKIYYKKAKNLTSVL